MKPVTALKIKALIHKSIFLTQWEQKFVLDLQGKAELTAKQKCKVDDIYSERIKGEFTGFSSEGVFYDDVHNFDRD